MSKLTILVASGTANTGSNVVRELSKRGDVNVRALTRNPASGTAQELAKLPNVTVVKGDFEDPASLKAALQGVTRAFLVSAPGDDAQFDRETAFIKAATDAGLDIVVRVSTANCLIDEKSEGVYARAHARIEKYIAEQNSKVLDLQPNWFMSNPLWQAAEIKAAGCISYPMTLDHARNMPPMAMIDPRDVAGAAVAVLTLPEDKLEPLLKARMVEVHGPETVTFAQALDAMSKAAGKEIKLNPITGDEYVQRLESAGTPHIMATSFRDTVLHMSGQKPTPRPLITKTSPALAAVWSPKYTVQQWAEDNRAAYA